MKYLLPLCLVLLIIALGLNQPLLDPLDYTGQWYSAADQSVYLFENGLIHCQRHTIPVSHSDTISGAYSFSRHSILLFAQGIEGLETEKELYPVHKNEGSFLCENKDGTGEIYFIRYK